MLGSRSAINGSPTLNATVNAKALTNGKPELVLSKGTGTDICCPVSTGVHPWRLLIPFLSASGSSEAAPTPDFPVIHHALTQRSLERCRAAGPLGMWHQGPPPVHGAQLTLRSTSEGPQRPRPRPALPYPGHEHRQQGSHRA